MTPVVPQHTGKATSANPVTMPLPISWLRAPTRDYPVLVTDVRYELAAIGQLCRDRCNCRVYQVSGFDELKSPWGWGGFITQDMHRSQVTALVAALICR